MAAIHFVRLALMILGVRVAALPLKPQKTFTTSDGPCSGCEFTVNLRCDGVRSARSAPYHRIHDCLIPLYGLIDMARNLSRNGTNVCAITWVYPWEGPNLTMYATRLAGMQWHKFVNEEESCAKDMQYHAINRTTKLMATDEYLSRFSLDKNMVKAYSVDLPTNIRLIQQDANKLVNAPKPHILVIQREDTSRSFRPVPLEDLKYSLSSRTGLPLAMYTGNEKVVDTIRLFNQANGIVGYHGAGWANTFFTAHPFCAQQISTFYDFDGKIPWRISSELRINPVGSWYFYYLPLRMILEANHIADEVYTTKKDRDVDKDHFIKDIEWIPLRSVDIEDLTSHMYNCLKDPASYATAHPRPQDEIHTRSYKAETKNMAGGTVAMERDWCTGCDFTVNLRCEGMALGRHDYYNRIAGCLLPMYEMIQLAREASINRTANVCALTWSETGRLNLDSFLTEFVDIKWHKIIYEDDPCIPHVKYIAANRTRYLGASSRYLNEFGTDKNMVRSSPIDMTTNLKWMQKDATTHAGRPKPHAIILQRPSFSRMFPQDILDQIFDKLSKFLHMPTYIYYGNESVSLTVKLFNPTAVIFGYYGDTWVNGLFASYPHCATQLSTFVDLNYTQPWRNNSQIKDLNPIGDWFFKYISLKQMLKGNNVSDDVFDNKSQHDKDTFIKDLPIIPLNEDNVVDLTSKTYLCWTHKERGYTQVERTYGRR